MIKKIINIALIFLFLTISKAFAYLPIATDSRIKTLVYSPTEVFRLKFHHNYQSYIEFPRNEKFKIISLGDSFAWNIKQVDNRLFIKPKQAGALTNMTIITNKRPYHFEVQSSEEDINDIDAELVYVARFYYPDTAYDFMQTVKLKKPLNQYNVKPLNQLIKKQDIENIEKPLSEKKEPLSKEAIEKEKGTKKEQRNRNYQYSMVIGNKTATDPDYITPTKIYDDGINTYFTFPSKSLPDIFYVNQDGSETPVKYYVKDGEAVVQNISWQFSLRDNNSTICIFNEKLLNFR